MHAARQSCHCLLFSSESPSQSAFPIFVAGQFCGDRAVYIFSSSFFNRSHTVKTGLQEAYPAEMVCKADQVQSVEAVAINYH